MLGVALKLTGANAVVQFLAGLLVALLIGFEAATLRRWKLTRRGWRMLGFVVGEDVEMAEHRFFAEWSKQTARPAGEQALAAPAPQVPAQVAAPLRRATPTDVIGLFPEPGRPR